MNRRTILTGLVGLVAAPAVLRLERRPQARVATKTLLGVDTSGRTR